MTATIPEIPASLAGFFAEPFAAELCQVANQINLDGQAWAVLSDGRMLLAVRMANDLPTEGNRVAGTKSILAAPEAEGREKAQTSVSALAAWAGPIPPLAKTECSSCGGDGECECPKCEDTHDCCCCDGTGERDVYETRHGIICGELIDMNRIARLCELIRGDCTLTVRANSSVKTVSMLRLDGDGWAALLMGIEGQDVSAPVFGA